MPYSLAGYAHRIPSGVDIVPLQESLSLGAVWSFLVLSMAGTHACALLVRMKDLFAPGNGGLPAGTQASYS
jgi:hypothetical protein